MQEVFAHLLSRNNEEEDSIRQSYLDWFILTFPAEEFSGEDRLFYEFLDYCGRLNIPVKEKYLYGFITNELRKLLIKYKIKTLGTETLDFDVPTDLETAVNVNREALVSGFRELYMIESEVQDFKVSADTFMTQRLNERTIDVLSKSYSLISDTDDPTIASVYATETLSFLNEIYDKDQLEELDETHTDDGTINLIVDSGMPAIDGDIGGIYETHLLGIEAQPGTGKTKHSLGVWVYRASVKYKRNCAFYTLEQSKKEIEDNLVARHLFELFKIQLGADLITKGLVPDELKPKVEAARIDLFESGKYGKIEIYETTLYLYNLVERLRSDDRRKGPFQLVVIDYMGLIEQMPEREMQNKRNYRHLEDYQIIGRSFKKFKRYVRKSRKGGIAISQLNQKGIDAGKADKEITTDMAQGGIEVYRNTDSNLAITMTEEMKLQQKRRFSQPKVRNSKGFGTFIARTRLGFCYFEQILTKKV